MSEVKQQQSHQSQSQNGNKSINNLLDQPVYQHLTKVIAKLLKEQPANPLELFESLSISIKQSVGTKTGSTTVPSSITAAISSLSDNERTVLLSLVEQQQRYLKNDFKAPKPVRTANTDDDEQEEDDQEEEQPEIPSFVPDLVANQSILSEAGFSVSSEELYKLQQSMDYLSITEESIESIRFWGKLIGTTADYYILEAKLTEYPTDNDNTVDNNTDSSTNKTAKAISSNSIQSVSAYNNVAAIINPDDDDDTAATPISNIINNNNLNSDLTELWGTGTNEYIYYINNHSPDSVKNWIKLPQCRPEYIVRSRGSRRYLTGKLDSIVLGFPRFEWREAAYIRALIARISASTIIAPIGKYNIEDAEANIILEAENYTGVSNTVLKSMKNWVHIRPYILSHGRTEHYLESELDNEAEELKRQEREKTMLKEKPVPILRPIADDRYSTYSKINSKSTNTAAWSIRCSSAIDTGYVALELTGKQIEDGVESTIDNIHNPHTVISAHSINWPGAVTVVKGKSVHSFYCGYGLKAINSDYKPPQPPTPQSEYKLSSADKEQIDITVKPARELTDDDDVDAAADNSDDELLEQKEQQQSDEEED